MRNKLVPTSALSFGLVVVLSIGAAGAATPTAITALAAAPGASAVAVSGKATFASGATVIGTDSTDALNHGKAPGSDLRSASIALADNNKDLVFTLDVANLPPAPAVFGPNVILTWPVSVDGVDSGYYLAAARAGLSGIDPKTDPFFDLLQDTVDGFVKAADLVGSVNGSNVSWVVPMTGIKAKLGSVVGVGAAAGGGVGATNGVPGAGVFYRQLDAMDVEEYTVPGAVSVGIAPASTADEAVVTGIAATVKSGGSTNGSFTASVARPATPGDYKIVSRACSTEDDCVTRSVLVTL